MNKKYLSVIVSAFLMGSTLFAQEIEISGTGKTPIVGNLNQVKSKAKNEAIKKAVLNAINKALGSDASKQPNIIAKLDDIIEQIDQFKTDEELKTDSDGVEYIVKYNMKFDDQKFRKLLTDLGIAVNTNTVRSSAILVLMDEYFTTPTDMKAPLEEVTTYSKDKSQYYKEGASDKSFDNSSDSSKYKNDTSVAASASRSGSGSYSYGNGYGSGYASGSSSAKGSINATDKSAGESQSSRSSGSESSSYVDATSMDKEFFQKTVKYQPRSAGPEKQNATLAALYHVLGEYDINHLDNDIFKSKYFGNKPITLEQLTNSEELTKYAVAAYADQKADYFAIGSTIIVDKGRSATTGNYTCDGTIAMKVYATSGQSQVISAGALNESASGSTPDQCKGNIGKKLADEFGSVLSAQIQDYYKKRQMYGKEYIVRLIGTYSLGQRNQFIKALNTISGVKSSKQRGNNEYVVTFGGDDIQTALTGDDKLMNDLKIMDAKVQGNELLICQTMECK